MPPQGLMDRPCCHSAGWTHHAATGLDGYTMLPQGMQDRHHAATGQDGHNMLDTTSITSQSGQYWTLGAILDTRGDTGHFGRYWTLGVILDTSGNTGH